MRFPGRLLIVVVVGALIGVQSAWSQTRPTVVVSRANGSSTRIAQAEIRIWSSRGYAFGGSFQAYLRLLVTDPVVAPEGVQLKPREVEWNTVQKIEWSAGPDTRKDDQRVEKVTYRDGRIESVFIWRPMGSDSYERLYSCHLRINGRMNLGGKDQDVQVGESESIARACLTTPIGSLEIIQ